ncbi:DUF4132 domain-containing protein [Tahibacter harae]|uniref:DUF4132 domain-containing protein n=1 Tax=Tahibacter harae TaxID=2963937 RepID=A0ABT1QP58_9GAMM|nr:DUF4132 domain-containing protein [Tahibacter harae]MCQ4164040.1 DUF4132 domain-containing protein [Tahibacter harae]
MRRFEFSEGTSNKFWEVEQAGADVNLRWGRIGTQGQSQTKNFADEAKAAAAVLKLVAEKTGKGYVERGDGVASGAAPAAAAASAPAAAKTVKKAAAGSGAAAVAAASDVVDSAAGEKKEDFSASGASAAPVAAPYEAAAAIVSTAPARQPATPAAIAAEELDLDALPQLPGVPPWLAAGEPLDYNAAWRYLEGNATALPTRRFPAPIEPRDPRVAWLSLRETLLQNAELDLPATDPALHALLQETWTRVQQRSLRGSEESDALLLAWAASVVRGETHSGSLAEFLIAERGLVQAFDLLLLAQTFEVGSDTRWQGNTLQRKYSAGYQVSAALGAHWQSPLSHEERLFRAHLAAADADVWQQCAQRLRERIAALHPARQAVMAVVLDDAQLADETAMRLTAAAGATLPGVAQWLRVSLRDPAALAALQGARTEHHYFFHDKGALATLLRERRLDMLPILLGDPASENCAELLRHIGLPEAVAALARIAGTSKSHLLRLNQAAQRWPLAALAALAGGLGAGPREAGAQAPLLTQLIANNEAALASLQPWLSPAAHALIERLHAQLAGPADVADATELPRVLADPPWHKPRKTIASVGGLAPLVLPLQEHWPAAERERAAQLSEWQRNRYKGNNALLQAIKDLGFESDWTSLDRVRDEELRKQALAAVKAVDAAALVALWRQIKPLRKHYYVSIDGAALSQLPDDVGVAFWNELVGEASSESDVEFVAARYGPRAWPGVLRAIRRNPGAFTGLALRYADTELAVVAARALTRLKTLRGFGRDWLLRYPQHAAAALIAPALGKPGEARDCAGSALRLLAANGHEALLLEMAARYGRDDVVAGLGSVLQEDALDRFPSKRAPAPAFWAPRSWRRPLLRGSGKALSDGALQHLGDMLAFPSHEELYAGIGQVAEACTRESLADFAWDLFNAWLGAGSPSKEGWALNALGWFGNDDTARRLTPLIRAWPGEAAHARAVAGLDVLAAIGSDVALMLLNGIAQKVKFKGLQDKAREKIDAIAQARGLSAEELEDRLAPDLGLDESGILILDFGPRQFRVGFDEALKPYVSDADGARLADLPKPRKTDDAALSAAAVERFKALKKDARTIAQQQVQRLEVAMCTRRRWSEDVFRQFLAGHPLLRHLVQRLVWGVYEMDSAEDSHGGRLLHCFRVAEDGSFSDAEDNPLQLGLDETRRIGLPHALELPADQAAAFGQLFADYELLQPFAQLGRDSHALTPEELGQRKLERWLDRVVPTGRVLGLVNKGWRRGQAQDGGCIWYFTKPLKGDRVIELQLDPGIIVGLVGEYAEQKLRQIQVGKPSAWGDMQDPLPLSELDAIAASELVRDMEYLTNG